MKHLVLFKNDTSGTHVIDESSITILEFREKGIVLTVPYNSCGESHALTLFMIKLPVNHQIQQLKDIKRIRNVFEILGKIESVTKPKERKGNWTIEISFTQYDVKEWTEFVLAYVKRQQDINSLKPEY